MMCTYTYACVIDAAILGLYPMELVHFDFHSLGGKADDNRSVNILIVTDNFTTYAQAYVTPKQTAVVVA